MIHDLDLAANAGNEFTGPLMASGFPRAFASFFDEATAQFHLCSGGVRPPACQRHQDFAKRTMRVVYPSG